MLAFTLTIPDFALGLIVGLIAGVAAVIVLGTWLNRNRGL